MDQLLDFGGPPAPQQQQQQQQPTQNQSDPGFDPLDFFSTPAPQQAQVQQQQQQQQQPPPVNNIPPQPQSVQPPQTETSAPSPSQNPAATSKTAAPATDSSALKQVDEVIPIMAPTRDDPDKFINDPVLLEIKKKFSGKWKLARSDPYDEFLKYIGVGLMSRKLANTSALEQEIFVRDNNVNIEFHSTFYNQIYKFRLNETQENLVNKIRQSVFCNYEKEKLLLQMTGVELGFAKTYSVERSINEFNELVVIYTSGPKTCRRYFERMEVVPTGPQV